MSAEPAGTTNFKVESTDGQQFDISYLAMKHSGTLKEIARSNGYDSNKPIKLKEFFQNKLKEYFSKEVDGNSLKRIVDWCTEHAEEEVYELDMKAPKNVEIPLSDEHFIPVDTIELFNFIVAADLLKTDRLLDYASKKVALMGQGRTPEEMREIYGIRDEGAEEPMDVEAPAEIVEDVEAPADVVEAPADIVEAPAEIVEAPVENVEAPAEDVVAEQGPRIHGKKSQKKTNK